MAKNFYAVKRGYDKKNDKEVTDLIFEDYADVRPLVAGYKKARYKGFDTKGDAEIWLSMVDRLDAERRGQKIIDEEKEKIGIENEPNESSIVNLDDIEILESIQKLKDLGYDKYKVYYILTKCIGNYIDKAYE